MYMERIKYLDFDLLIEKFDDAYRARIVNSPVGQASANFTSPFTADEIQKFFMLVGRVPLNQLPQTNILQANHEAVVRQTGQRLFDAAFHDEVLTSYRRSCDTVGREQKGLRVRLRLNDVPELADLPWEYMYDASRRAFLALSKETPIVRYLELPEPVAPLGVHAPIHLLAVLASPNNRDTLDVEGEWTRMQKALQDLVAQNKITLTRVQPPTLDALQTQLRKNKYHILHFIGHGDFDDAVQQGSLVFETEARPPQAHGDARSVNDDVFATLLRGTRDLRVVVLNACQGAQTSVKNPFAGTAPRLVQAGIPAVLAMQYSISDQAALDFSSEFYRTLADGFPIDAAMNEARRAIYFKGSVVEWGTPVLFMRAPDGMIFEPLSVQEIVQREQVHLAGEQRVPDGQARKYPARAAQYPKNAASTDTKSKLIVGLIMVLLLGGVIALWIFNPNHEIPTTIAEATIVPAQQITASAQPISTFTATVTQAALRTATSPICVTRPRTLSNVTILGKAWFTKPVHSACTPVSRNEAIEVEWENVQEGVYYLWILQYTRASDEYYPKEVPNLNVISAHGVTTLNIPFGSMEPYELILVLTDQTANEFLKLNTKGFKRTQLHGAVVEKDNISVYRTQ